MDSIFQTAIDTKVNLNVFPSAQYFLISYSLNVIYWNQEDIGRIYINVSKPLTIYNTQPLKKQVQIDFTCLRQRRLKDYHNNKLHTISKH